MRQFQTLAAIQKQTFETAASGNNGKVDLHSPPAELFLKEECCGGRQLPENPRETPDHSGSHLETGASIAAKLELTRSAKGAMREGLTTVRRFDIHI